MGTSKIEKDIIAAIGSLAPVSERGVWIIRVMRALPRYTNRQVALAMIAMRGAGRVRLDSVDHENMHAWPGLAQLSEVYVPAAGRTVWSAHLVRAA